MDSRVGVPHRLAAVPGGTMIFLRRLQGKLYSKYAVYFVALVSAALLASGGLGLYFSHHETGAAVFALQRAKGSGGGADLPGDVLFLEPRKGATWFSPVYFHKETEPYMTIAMPTGRDGGATIAEVNLKFVWDVVSRIQVGATGYAYVVDASGRLVSHPDISLVLQNTDLSALPQVRAALAPGSLAIAGAPDSGEGRDRAGRPVLAAFAPLAAPGV